MSTNIAVFNDVGAQVGPLATGEAGVVAVGSTGHPTILPDLLLPFFKFGNYGEDDTLPVDGSIRHQGLWNLDNDHKFINAGTIAVPDWRAM